MIGDMNRVISVEGCNGGAALSTNHLTQHNVIHGKPPPPLEWIVVRIEVTDTGCGIRPKDMIQSKLFCASLFFFLISFDSSQRNN